MESEYLEYTEAMELQKMKVRKIRDAVNSLTDEVIIHLNKINRILTEVENAIYQHPNAKENYP